MRCGKDDHHYGNHKREDEKDEERLLEECALLPPCPLVSAVTVGEQNKQSLLSCIRKS